MSEERAFNQAAQELGAVLKAKRLEKKIAIGEVAERLKFTAKKIESLESGDYKGLPEPIFVKGFIKTYARFLEIDNDALNVLLDQTFPNQALKSHQHSHRASSSDDREGLNFQNQTKPFRLPKWLPLVGVVVLAALAIGFWQSKSTEQVRAQEKSTLEVGEIAQPALDNPNVQVVPMAASSVVASAVSSPASVAASAPVTASAPVVMDGVLHVKIRYRSNLIVTDADGTPLHSGIVASNSVHQFKGKAPFKVRIGYATGSEISFNGQVIDMKNHYVDGKTAALTVPQQ